MKIDIHELKKKSEVTFNGEQTISLRGLTGRGKEQQCIVYVQGTAVKNNKGYLVKGSLKTSVKLVCDRCLEEFNYPLEAEICQEYSATPVLNADDEEIIEVTGSTIDLEDIITEAIYLSVPMKKLHDEACKGVCKVCGQNLNKHTCNCQTQDVDPRLEVLKNIFHPQSEE